MRSHARRRTFGAVAGVCALLLSGCGDSSDGASGGSASAGSAGSAPVSVVASTNVYGDIAKQVGGDKVKITSIISDPAQDPHSYEANTQTQLELSKAKVVIENGGGYDDFVDTMLKTAKNSSAEVLNVVEISGKTAPAGEGLNEHVWYDLPTVGKLADRLAASLAKADPANGTLFTQNAAAFKSRLAPLQAKAASVKAAKAGTAVAITEPVPGYLLEACGLEDKTPAAFSEAVEEGGDVSPKVLQDTLALFTGKQVKALVYNAQTAGPETQKLEQAAKSNGVGIVPVTETLPSGKDYVTWMTGNLSAIEAAL
jgi:zinc/manganese transport system substrate-binding protein